MRRTRTMAAVVASLAVATALAVSIGPVWARSTGGHATTITQPSQPKDGPGGRSRTHRGVRVTSGGTGADAWYVFEPTRPRPRKAPVAVVMHGYYEFSGYTSLRDFIRHTVSRGTIAIYPRWQTGVAAPCPGPFNIEPCIASAANGIKGAIDYLRADRDRVQPQLGRASYFGFSFGGIISADLANRWRSLELPKPRAIFLDDIHDGGFAGPGEPALDDSLAGIPSATKIECHVGAEGIIAKDPTGSCNALFPRLRHIPNRNKDLVLTRPDRHGEPSLSSGHGVCETGPTPAPGFGRADAYDWNFCWKVWDALRSCALSDRDCRYALGPAREHVSMGRWSDGRPVKRLKVQNSAPIPALAESAPSGVRVRT